MIIDYTFTICIKTFNNLISIPTSATEETNRKS